MTADLVGRGEAIAERLNALSGYANGQPDEPAVPGSRNRDTELGTGRVPGSLPSMREPGTEPEKSIYVDISALLDGTLPEPPAPVLLKRSDGVALFYAGQVNFLFGDPEAGKSWVCLAAARRGTDGGPPGPADRLGPQRRRCHRPPLGGSGWRRRNSCVTQTSSGTASPKTVRRYAKWSMTARHGGPRSLWSTR
jgi:hypothetical protein